MTDSTPPALAAWLVREGVALGAGLRLQVRRARPSGQAYQVRAGCSVASGSSVAQIPKRALLSDRTCSIAPELLGSLPQSTPDAFRLAVCVLHELSLGPQSRWAAYLQHCPPETVPIALLWPDGGKPVQIIQGTELHAELERIGISNASLATFFIQTAHPTCFASSAAQPHPPPYSTSPTLAGFLHAYSLVSSRAFQVDAFHRLALVPLADLFNHSTPNHVHLASDDFVCPECGSLHECEHDRDGGDGDGREVARAMPTVEDETCEMVAAAAIEAGEEVFNTYGQLANVSLLAYYGFMLEANELDKVTFTLKGIAPDPARRARLAEWRTDAGLAMAAADLDLDGLVSAHSHGHTTAFANSPVDDDYRTLWIDAEASVSWPLFLALTAAALDHAPDSPAGGLQASQAAAALQATAEYWSACNRLSESNASPPDKRAKRDGGSAPRRTDAATVARVAAEAQSLVEARIARQYRPELSGVEILELAEEEGNEEEGDGEEGDGEEGGGPRRLALEFVANERLVLECVAAKWGQLATFCRAEAEAE